MADSDLTTLLENIEATFTDATNFATLAGILKNSSKNKAIAPIFRPIHAPVPYCVVTPGGSEKFHTEGRWDIQEINVHIVHAVLSSAQHYYSVLGTASTEGILTVAEEVEKALVRPNPYGHSPYLTAGGIYTTQTSVKNAKAVSLSELEPVTLPFLEDVFVKQVLTVQYRIEKGA
jgi:hypothetical protein